MQAAQPSSDMKVIHDGRYAYKGFHRCDSVCHLRICKDARETVVIATDVADNRGTSVTNVCEELATEVCRRFHIRYASLVWIARRPGGKPIAGGAVHAEGFDLVTFQVEGRGRFGLDPGHLRDPRWHPITRSALERRLSAPVTPAPTVGSAARSACPCPG